MFMNPFRSKMMLSFVNPFRLRCGGLLTVLCLALNVNPSFADEFNQLFAAAVLGKPERVKFLLSDGVAVNSQTETGKTALMGACFNGNIRVVKVLLTYGADVNLKDEQGITALMDAVMFGSEKLVELLIVAGADVEAKDKQGVSALDRAQKAKLETIVTLLEQAVKQQTDTKNTDDPSAQ
jgi:ankyrin repeat protein